MKSGKCIFLISFLAAISLINFSCGGDEPQASGAQPDDTAGIIAAANHKVVTMRAHVPCDVCKARIEGVLKTEPGVVRYAVFKSAERTENIIIEYDPQQIQLEAIKTVFTKLNKPVDNVKEI